MDRDPSGTSPTTDEALPNAAQDKSTPEIKRSDGSDDKSQQRSTARTTSSTAELLARTESKEVSAATVGRMLGLATSSDLKLMEGKLDLIQAKVTNMTVRLEKALSMLQSAPTGSDLERVDVQLGSLRTLILEVLTKNQVAVNDVAEQAAKSDGQKPRARIISSNRTDAEEESNGG